jgi:type II secretory pathway component GspD/PulD (secretin)
MQDRLFRLTHTATVQEFQEIANVVRTITEIRDFSADNAQMTLSAHGTAEQIGLAEWLVKQLDQPVGGAIPTTSPEYKGLSDTDEQRHAITNGVARVFYLAHAANVQDFQEAANAIRTVTEIRRVFTYNDGRAMVVRGTPEQMAMAERLVHELDQAEPGKQSSTAGEYTVGKDDVMRVLYVANAKSVQDFQEIANTVRTIVEIRRMFTVNTPRAVLIRSTPDQMAMAEWLLGNLDIRSGEQQNQASGEYRVPGAADDVMHVFYVANAKSVQDFQAIANAVRTATEIRRVFTYNAQRALAIRGTVNQLALAETLIHDLSR